MGKVVGFHGNRRSGLHSHLPEPAKVIILPVIRIERHTEPTAKTPLMEVSVLEDRPVLQNPEVRDAKLEMTRDMLSGPDDYDELTAYLSRRKLKDERLAVDRSKLPHRMQELLKQVDRSKRPIDRIVADMNSAVAEFKSK